MPPIEEVRCETSPANQKFAKISYRPMFDQKTTRALLRTPWLAVATAKHFQLACLTTVEPTAKVRT
jgi:hypothetical protein